MHSSLNIRMTAVAALLACSLCAPRVVADPAGPGWKRELARGWDHTASGNSSTPAAAEARNSFAPENPLWHEFGIALREQQIEPAPLSIHGDPASPRDSAAWQLLLMALGGFGLWQLGQTIQRVELPASFTSSPAGRVGFRPLDVPSTVLPLVAPRVDCVRPSCLTGCRAVESGQSRLQKLLRMRMSPAPPAARKTPVERKHGGGAVLDASFV